MRRFTISLFAMLGAVVAQAASVEVHFVQVDQYADAGRDVRSREEVQQGLGQHLKRLGATLPNSQLLAIDVLDIDLAGEIRPLHRVWPDIRVMRGGADWPRITLRYTLRDGSALLTSGEERLSDMNYLVAGAYRGYDQGEALRYEKRMLDRWFNERFGKRP